MRKYIALLRGINVSGKNRIIMADLKKLYENIGFVNITTYIQSGNLVFEYSQDTDNKIIQSKIKKEIFKKFNYEIPVIVRTKEEIETVFSINPFLNINEIKTEKLYVTFLADKPSEEKLQRLIDIDYSPDKFEIIGNNIFIHCPDKYGKTKLSNNFFEGKLKVTATTRNWKTISKLVEIANQ